MPDTDEELIATIKQNDYISYNELFKRYYDRLYNYVYSFLKHADDTKDVVQEVFIHLWGNRKHIHIEGKASSYLYRMAKNAALNHLRTQNNYSVLLEKQAKTSTTFEEDPLELEEFRIALYNCINSLPNRSKEILILSRIKRLSQKEIADKLSISVKTIKNQLWIALKKIKDCMDAKNK